MAPNPYKMLVKPIIATGKAFDPPEATADAFHAAITRLVQSGAVGRLAEEWTELCAQFPDVLSGNMAMFDQLSKAVMALEAYISLNAVRSNRARAAMQMGLPPEVDKQFSAAFMRLVGSYGLPITADSFTTYVGALAAETATAVRLHKIINPADSV